MNQEILHTVYQEICIPNFLLKADAFLIVIDILLRRENIIFY
jgi:hypothetical protein